MKRNSKKILIVLLLVVLIGIGYAALVSTLNINGYANMKSNTFDIHFDNVTFNPNNVFVNSTLGEYNATIDPNDNTVVNYSVALSKPGDLYEFNVDAVNNGTMEGEIAEIISTLKINNAEPITIEEDGSNLPDYLEYNLTYLDGTKIEGNQTLESGERVTYKVRLKFKEDIEPEDLPQEVKVLAFGMRSMFRQAPKTASAPQQPAENYVYSFYNFDGSNYISIGDTLADIGNPFQELTYNTYCYIDNNDLENGEIKYNYSLSCLYSHDIGYNEFESIGDCQNYLNENEYSDYTCIQRPKEAVGNLSTDWSVSGAKTMLRLSVNNSNVIERVDVCYVKNNNLYCLKGVTSGEDPNKEQIYNDNKAILNSTFNNCNLDYGTQYSCSDSTIRYIDTDLNASEFADVSTQYSVKYYGESGVYCYVYTSGGGSCGLPS